MLQPDGVSFSLWWTRGIQVALDMPIKRTTEATASHELAILQLKQCHRLQKALDCTLHRTTALVQCSIWFEHTISTLCLSNGNFGRAESNHAMLICSSVTSFTVPDEAELSAVQTLSSMGPKHTGHPPSRLL